MARRKRKTPTPTDWQDLPDEQLLQWRVRDLGLKIAESRLAPCVEQLYAELDERGIRFHPACYLADEWFTPDRVPTIGIPFYLAHNRLKQLEQKMMLEVEGGTDATCMKLLRHEAGHALNYAHLLFQRTRWRKLFGPMSKRYTNSYPARPYSKRYVVHLEDNYAQAHPDEDFAETFAVWLAPGSNWQQRYCGWPALKKLRYVDHLMADVGGAPPRGTRRETPWSAARMTSTLAAFYERKRTYLGADYPAFYDPGLRRLFPGEADRSAGPKASQFLRKWRKLIVGNVATWNKVRKFDVDTLIRRLTKRCDALELYVQKPEEEALSEVTAFVAAAINKIHRFVETAEKK